MDKGKNQHLIGHDPREESGLGIDRDLLKALRDLIRSGRQRALRAVDTVQVRTCWEIGRHIVEFEQKGETRAVYGKRLLNRLADELTAEFGKGFDASNLRYMRLFYQAFPIRDALRHELSWTHYRMLLRVQDAAARQWYMNEAATQNWCSRALDRQIGYQLYCFWRGKRIPSFQPLFYRCLKQLFVGAGKGK